jgi:hypothetical protein
MRFESRAFWLSKDVAFPDEYQDAFRWDDEQGIAAIADGVSSTIFSRCWARILTQGAVAERPQPHDKELFQAWLSRQRTNWTSQIDTSRLTWYQRPKMVDGAMSTLLWIELEPFTEEEGQQQPGYHLNGWAIGDCCLFHLRENRLLRTFPIADAAEFGLNPAVLASIDRQRDHLIEFQELHVPCCPGDLLVLCSDALALWAMNRYAAGDTIAWDAYWDMPNEVWQEEIFAQREANLMRFDDTTLVLLHLVPNTTEGKPMPSESSSIPAGTFAASETALETADAALVNKDLTPLVLASEAEEPAVSSSETEGALQRKEPEIQSTSALRRVLGLARSYLAPRSSNGDPESDLQRSPDVAEQDCESHSVIPTDAKKSDQPCGDG